jgi:uncharacterized membrane protein
MTLAGVLGGLAAAPFGLLDWLHIPGGSRARRVGAWHGGGNLLVLALFALSWQLREPESDVPAAALMLSLVAVALALVTAWLGAELVSRLGVGVDEQAGVNATSSLHPDEPSTGPHTHPRPN